jgi:hypothetical protein
MIGMCDRLIEDIVAVTETLMVADVVDLEAFAHPDGRLTLNDKISRANEGKDSHYGIARKDKANNLRSKLIEHLAGDGVFRRGSC